LNTGPITLIFATAAAVNIFYDFGMLITFFGLTLLCYNVLYKLISMWRTGSWTYVCILYFLS